MQKQIKLAEIQAEKEIKESEHYQENIKLNEEIENEILERDYIEKEMKKMKQRHTFEMQLVRDRNELLVRESAGLNKRHLLMENAVAQKDKEIAETN